MYEMLEYLAVERIDSTNEFEHMNIQFTTRGCFRKMAQNDVMIVLSRIQQTVSISSFFFRSPLLVNENAVLQPKKK